jgi:hypothetical protein
MNLILLLTITGSHRTMKPNSMLRSLLMAALFLTLGAAQALYAQDARPHRGIPGKGLHPTHPGPHRTAEQVARPVVRDSIQVVEIAVGAHGYAPRRIELKAGMPVRLVFTRTVVSACLEHVQAPALGIEPTELALNQAVAVEFTPAEGGEFTFTCGMDMQKGTLLIKS